jgi:hypothetical protein
VAYHTLPVMRRYNYGSLILAWHSITHPNDDFRRLDGDKAPTGAERKKRLTISLANVGNIGEDATWAFSTIQLGYAGCP